MEVSFVMTKKALFFALLIAALACVTAHAQVFVYETTTTKASVHVPLASSATVTFSAQGLGASVYCATASTATLARGGTAPTTTEGLAVSLNGVSTIDASDVQVFTDSNVGSGTTLKTYTIAAGQEVGIDLSQFGLTKGKTITISTTSSCRIFFIGRVR